MNGIIYCIINKINDKKYVGQTSKNLKVRYPCNWWKYSHNGYLKNSIEKYGINNFEWEILHENIKSLEELNKLEIYYAQKLNSYIPNGYNIRLCGENKVMHEETKRKISIANSKSRILKDVYGNIFHIDNLRDFCKEKGLNRSAILNLLCGISNYSQGYMRMDTDVSKVRMAKIYSFISPSDEVIRGTITEISKKFNIKNWVLSHLINGKLKKSKGWRLLN